MYSKIIVSDEFALFCIMTVLEPDPLQPADYFATPMFCMLSFMDVVKEDM